MLRNIKSINTQITNIENSINNLNTDIDNLGKEKLIYSAPGVAIYRILDRLGLLVLSTDITFNNSVQIGYMYKYYHSEYTTTNNIDFSIIGKYVNLWCGLLFMMANSSHHAFVVFNVHGAMQCVGNSTWALTGKTYVELLV